jgi:transposase
MSTSLLYHTQGVHGFTLEKFDFSGAKTEATIRRCASKFQCPVCCSSHVTPTFVGHRTIKSLPIGQHQFFLCVKMHRIRCHRCHAYRMEKLPFLPSAKVGYTRVLARTIIELRSEMSISAIATYFGLHWSTVKEIEKIHLRKKYRHISLKDVRIIGIDEIYIGNMRFLTIVRDLETGAVVHIGSGKGADSLKKFAHRLKVSKCNIEAVAVDFSPAYTSWINDQLPNATIVYDHFHLIKLINDKLDKIRRRTMNELQEEEKTCLKNKRWLLLRNFQNLNQDDQTELQRLRKIYKDLGDASLLKESLRNIYALATDVYLARRAFKRWCELANKTQIKELKTMAKTILTNLSGILSFWTVKISTAAMEGFNNKIRWLVRQAYGYRDIEYFRLKLFDLPNIRTDKTI